MQASQYPLLGKGNLLDAISRAQLPALPDSAIQLLELSRDPDRDCVDFAKPIEGDVALATQVLRFVNSSYFGFSDKVGDVRRAIAMLGIRKIKSFVLWTAVFKAIADPRRQGFSMSNFRSHALRRGLLAQRLAKRLGADNDEGAFTAALLQDVAVPVLLAHIGDGYFELLEESGGCDARLAALEQERFGWTHGDVACELLQRWSLPEALPELLRQHSQPESVVAEANGSPEANAVALSSLAPALGDDGWGDIERFQQCCEQLDLGGPTALEEILTEVDEAFGDFAQAIKVGAFGNTLAEQYAEATAIAAGE